MNIFSKMRITHKISALMVALVLGFILIGITYYVQVNLSQAAYAKEKEAFLYQQKLFELNQLELNLSLQTNNISADTEDPVNQQILNTQKEIKNKLQEVKELTIYSSVANEVNAFEQSFNSYTKTLAQKPAVLDTMPSAEAILEIIAPINDIDASLQEYNTYGALSDMRSALGNYLGDTTQINRDAISTVSSVLIHTISENPQIEDTNTLTNEISALITRVLSIGEDSYSINQQIIERQKAVSSTIDTLITNAEILLEEQVEAAANISQTSQAAVTAIIFFVAMGTAVGIYLIYKSIVFPMAHMQSVINRINRGKTKARVKMLSNDELGDLGTAFNKLFDERIDQLETQSKENEKLNNSIIDLIQALGAIAKKDLTIKVPVSSDITGIISDAVNLLASETAETLHEVKNISHDVNQASETLQNQSSLVMQFAESERLQIIATSKALRVLASAMNEVANQSAVADKSATEAIESTQTAKKAVVETVTGIRAIRETISETEKRTKRLGDRSQEISGIVNLINTIAERTHILALNASMHAASAGEAGKGFAVVAEEVQRLAENARQSTDEISAMVNNMRVETSDTVNIMNKLISQVAEGSKMAEQAGREMESTETATRELVTTVKQIATQAVQQATVANRVKDRTSIIRNFTDKTEKQLKEQKVYTDNLSKYAEDLVERVNVFKLPQDTSTSAMTVPSSSTPSSSATPSPAEDPAANTTATNVSPIKSAV